MNFHKSVINKTTR